MKLNYVSASQVQAFNNCNRFWFLGWVKKLKAPQTPSQARGSCIHEEAEYTTLNSGIIRPSPFAPYVESMLPHLPIGEKHVLVEKKIEIPVKGIIWTGFIDLVEGHVDPLRITDHKTLSDFRYAKTPAELSTEVQLVSYAKWVYQEGHEGPIQLRHLYIKTAKKTPRKPKVMPVDVTVSQNHVEEVWNREIRVIDEMKEIALLEDPQDVEPNQNFCPKYGGCPHRGTSNCILPPMQFGWSSTNQNTKGKDNLMANSFLDKLKAKKKTETKTETKSETKKVKSGGSLAERLAAKKAAASESSGSEEETPNEGVLPPDAPDRTTPVETKTEEPKEETKKTTKKRGRPKKSKTSETKEIGTDGFMLYIDCMPIKGEDADIPLFEDWVAPIIAKINEEVMEEKKLPSYQLLPFSEEKAIFNLAISEAEVPPALIINSSSMVAREALAVLVPHAQKVFRGLR